MRKINFVFKSACPRTLNTLMNNFSILCRNNNITFSAFILPTKKKLFDLLKAPFIYKRSMHQFYFSTSKLLINIVLNDNQSLNFIKDDASVAPGPGIEVKIISQDMKFSKNKS